MQKTDSQDGKSPSFNDDQEFIIASWIDHVPGLL